jgi:hypothetical protein
MGKVLKSWTSIELKMFKKYISRDIKNGLVTGMELKNLKTNDDTAYPFCVCCGVKAS